MPRGFYIPQGQHRRMRPPVPTVSGAGAHLAQCVHQKGFENYVVPEVCVAGHDGYNGTNIFLYEVENRRPLNNGYLFTLFIRDRKIHISLNLNVIKKYISTGHMGTIKISKRFLNQDMEWVE